MIRNYLVIMTILALMTLLLGGCGGNGAGALPISRHTANAVFTIKWPARSRLIPEASNCVVVTMTDASGFAMSKEADRPAGGNNASISTVECDGLPTDNILVVATAYPQTGGSGVAQASGMLRVTPVAGQTTTINLTMNTTIDYLTITPSYPNVGVGATLTLAATAYDSAGDMVLLTPGNVTWTSASQAIATVGQTSGVVTGVNNGSTTITATDSESGKSGTASFSVGIRPGGTILATAPVGNGPYGIAVNPTTNRVYVTNDGDNTVSVLDGSTNSVIATVPVGLCPQQVAVNPTTNRVYVSNAYDNTVSVIDGNANKVLSTVTVGNYPYGVAVNPTTQSPLCL